MGESRRAKIFWLLGSKNYAQAELASFPKERINRSAFTKRNVMGLVKYTIQFQFALPMRLKIEEKMPQQQFDQHSLSLTFESSKLQDMNFVFCVAEKRFPGPTPVALERTEHKECRKAGRDARCISVIRIIVVG